jgi:hypothetical protein
MNYGCIVENQQTNEVMQYILVTLLYLQLLLDPESICFALISGFTLCGEA